MITDNKEAEKNLRKAVRLFKKGEDVEAMKFAVLARRTAKIYHDSTGVRIWNTDGLWIEARAKALEELIVIMRVGR